jgi:hypothetical protein
MPGIRLRTIRVMCKAMYAFYGKRRSYEEEAEERTLLISFARRAHDIPLMKFFRKWLGIFLHV